MTLRGVSRRALLAGAGGVGLTAVLEETLRAGSQPAQNPFLLRIDDLVAGAPINPFVYGSNELGTMEGNGASVEFDRAAGVTIRRLGGDLMTPYNWVNNATNAGKDYRHANGPFLLGVLGVAKERWGEPGAVVEAFLANSRAIGARSLLTLPLAGFVAADLDGDVSEAEAAPSPRFTSIDWSTPAQRTGAVNIPAFLERLVERHGAAASGGVLGYYLDNEPGLWPQTHPRIVRKPVTIRELIDRSLTAAKAIKSADPSALVLGPASWGAPEFTDFQKAPDWGDFKQHSSFLGAYLDAFRRESERAGARLLDALDLHFYPASRRGDIFRSEDEKISGAILDAPRSFDDSAFCEDSWVADTLGCRPRDGLFLPLLASLKRIVDEKYPGTALSFGEFNFGGAGLVATGLAVADVLGRFGRFGVGYATHWGALNGFVGEAYRLYRETDRFGDRFGDMALLVEGGAPELSAFAAKGRAPGAVSLVVLNKSEKAVEVELALTSGRVPELRSVWGFDVLHRQSVALDETAAGGAFKLVLPARAARRYSFA